MNIDKQQIVEMLRERGEDDKAQQAESSLPDQVDTERDSGMLQQLGIDPSDLMSRVTGGRDIPGL
jgi:hypothetical protein